MSHINEASASTLLLLSQTLQNVATAAHSSALQRAVEEEMLSILQFKDAEPVKVTRDYDLPSSNDEKLEKLKKSLALAKELDSTLPVGLRLRGVMFGDLQDAIQKRISKLTFGYQQQEANGDRENQKSCGSAGVSPESPKGEDSGPAQSADQSQEIPTGFVTRCILLHVV